MRSNFIKKAIISTLMLSIVIVLGTTTLPRPTVVQADDLYDDDRYDNDRYDDDRYDNDDDRYDDDRYYAPPTGGTAVPAPTPSVARPTPNRTAIEEYLRKVYTNIFGREIDQPGLTFWTNALVNGQVELDDFFKRILVEQEFNTVAPTIQDKIKKIYLGVFQREADPAGLKYWMGRYELELRDEGTPREALEEIIEEMTDGPEFAAILAKLGLFDND